MRIVVLALLMAGCTETANLDRSAPIGTFQSTKLRSAIAECLLNRLSGNAMRPEQNVGAHETTLRFTSTDQWTNPGLYLFTIRDAPSGSVVEARMPHGFVKRGLPSAETCFS